MWINCGKVLPVVSINSGFRFTVYYVLCYYYESDVGGGFIRPGFFRRLLLAGSMNRTPTLIQRQAGLFSIFTGTGSVKTGNACPTILCRSLGRMQYAPTAR